MMTFKYGSGQVIVLLATRFTLIALPIHSIGVKTAFFDQPGIAIQTFYPAQSAHMAYFFIAILLVNQMVYMEKYDQILPACFSINKILDTD